MKTLYNKLEFDIDLFGPEHIAIILVNPTTGLIEDYYLELNSIPESQKNGYLKVDTLSLRGIKNQLMWIKTYISNEEVNSLTSAFLIMALKILY